MSALPSASTPASTAERFGQGVAVGANPFSRVRVLVMVLLGAGLLLAVLWMIGTGRGLAMRNDGQAHADGKGVNGYAALARFLGQSGYDVTTVTQAKAVAGKGLLVLTPPAYADGKEIADIVSAQRSQGPTLVILPKWQPAQPQSSEKAKRGWVHLDGVTLPEWRNFEDKLSVRAKPLLPQQRFWILRSPTGDVTGQLPDGRVVLSGAGAGLVRLVGTRDGKRTLAGFLDDGGSYPGLEALTTDRVLYSGRDAAQGLPPKYPLIVVFEPDLLNNYGFNDAASAHLADTLVRASGIEPGAPVRFDLTLNGYGHQANLLTLAFTPPFLGVTVCLILVGFALGWRAFIRFGPPIVGDRAIAFGKRALVENSAGFVRRSRRWHLLGKPYADISRARLLKALALPRSLSAEQADAAIDRALASRTGGHDGGLASYSVAAQRLEAARRPQDLLHTARDLHALERMLIR